MIEQDEHRTHDRNGDLPLLPVVENPPAAQSLRVVVVLLVLAMFLIVASNIAQGFYQVSRTSDAIDTVNVLVNRGDCRSQHQADLNIALGAFLNEVVKPTPNRVVAQNELDQLNAAAHAYAQCGKVAPVGR